MLISERRGCRSPENRPVPPKVFRKCGYTTSRDPLNGAPIGIALRISRDRTALTAFELSIIKRPALENKSINLEHRRQMNQVETFMTTDGVPYCFCVHVEFLFERSN